jgi:TPR repeat protein
MKAATAGHTTAKYAVGEAFEEARGVPQSDEEACLWYYKAAVEGDEDSRKALRRLESIARIVVPGVRALLLLGD